MVVLGMTINEAMDTIEIEMLLFMMVMLVIAGVVIAAVVSKMRDISNDAQPVLEAVATVVDKQQVSNGAGITPVVWVMFETETGERVRLNCSSMEYIVGDKGYLRWQGSRVCSFARGQTTRTSGLGCSQEKIPTWKRIQMEEEQQRLAPAENKNNKCIFCGAEMAEGQLFCGACGKRKN